MSIIRKFNQMSKKMFHAIELYQDNIHCLFRRTYLESVVAFEQNILFKIIRWILIHALSLKLDVLKKYFKALDSRSATMNEVNLQVQK